jgi:hypothetical protein
MKNTFLSPLFLSLFVLYIGDKDSQVRGLEDAVKSSKISSYIQKRTIEDAYQFLAHDPRAKSISFIMSEFDQDTLAEKINLKQLGFSQK